MFSLQELSNFALFVGRKSEQIIYNVKKLCFLYTELSNFALFVGRKSEHFDAGGHVWIH